MKGRTLALSQLPDKVFSAGIMGCGMGIIPLEGDVFSPMDAEVDSMLSHAVSLKGKNGAELLIHIGMDTVELRGEGFCSFVKEGDRVKRGQLLLRADLSFIAEKGFDTVTAVTVTNSDDFSAVTLITDRSVDITDPIIVLGEKKR